jgi:hypothetical protein
MTEEYLEVASSVRFMADLSLDSSKPLRVSNAHALNDPIADTRHRLKVESG